MQIVEPEVWSEPIDPRSRYRLCRAAFGLAMVGATLSSLSLACHALSWLIGSRPLVDLTRSRLWEWIFRVPALGLTLFAAFILIDRWPDRRWRVRAGTLAFIITFGTCVWAIDQAEMLGLPLPPTELREDMLKTLVSAFLGCIGVVLLAGAADDVCHHLGEPGFSPLARGVRLTAGMAAALLVVVMVHQIDWVHGWPFRRRGRFNAETFLMYIGWLLSRATTSALVAILCGHACTLCSRELGHLERLRREDDPFRAWTK